VELRRAGLAPEETPAATSLYRKGWSFARLGAKFGVDALLCGGRCERPHSHAFTKQAKQVMSGLILTAKFAQMLRLCLNRKYGAK
jgi:hypothetical protein